MSLILLKYDVSVQIPRSALNGIVRGTFHSRAEDLLFAQFVRHRVEPCIAKYFYSFAFFNRNFSDMFFIDSTYSDPFIIIFCSLGESVFTVISRTKEHLTLHISIPLLLHDFNITFRSTLSSFANY